MAPVVAGHHEAHEEHEEENVCTPAFTALYRIEAYKNFFFVAFVCCVAFVPVARLPL
jgi:hypothetical protein